MSVSARSEAHQLVLANIAGDRIVAAFYRLGLAISRKHICDELAAQRGSSATAPAATTTKAATAAERVRSFMALLFKAHDAYATARSRNVRLEKKRKKKPEGEASPSGLT